MTAVREKAAESPQAPRGAGAVRRRRSPFEIGGLVLAAGMTALFLFPVVNTGVGALVVDGRFAPEGALGVLTSPELPGVLLNTVIVMVAAGLCAVVIGTAFAWLNERTDARLGVLGTLLPLVPLLLPPVALSIGWFFLAQPTTGYLNVVFRALSPWHERVGGTGPLDIGTWPGLIWVYTLHLVPFAYLTVSAAFRNADPALEEASRVSGAGVARTLFRVSLPAVRPAIGAAMLLVSLSSVALYSIPTIIGTNARIEVLSVHIVRLVRLTFPARLYEGVVLSFVMMVLLLGVWLVQQRLSASGRHSTIGGKATQASLVRLGGWKWVARIGMIGYLLASSVLPFGALLLVSLTPFWTPDISLAQLGLDNFVELWGNVNARNSLLNSLGLGLVGATLGMAIAAVMMTQAHTTGGRVKRVLEAVTKAPGAVSNIIIGVAFLITYSGPPFLLYGTVAILLLAYLVIYLPQASIQASTAIQQIGPELAEASAMSGASRGRTFRRISFPLMLPGLAAGWAMLFVLMVGDLTASALLAGTRNPVVGFVILNVFENGDLTQLAALAVIICVVSAVVVGAVLLFTRRRRTRRGPARTPLTAPVR